MAVAQADNASVDYWPWAFRALGYHIGRKGTMLSAINTDMWSSAVMAEHSDYTAAGSIQLARDIVQEAGRDEAAEMKALMADMPEYLRGPPPGQTSGPGPSNSLGDASHATEAGDRQTPGDGAGPSGTEKQTDKNPGRRTTKEAQDYNKLGGGGTAQKKAPKRPSAHPKNTTCVGSSSVCHEAARVTRALQAHTACTPHVGLLTGADITVMVPACLQDHRSPQRLAMATRQHK